LHVDYTTDGQNDVLGELTFTDTSNRADNDDSDHIIIESNHVEVPKDISLSTMEISEDPLIPLLKKRGRRPKDPKEPKQPKPPKEPKQPKLPKQPKPPKEPKVAALKSSDDPAASPVPSKLNILLLYAYQSNETKIHPLHSIATIPNTNTTAYR